MHDSTGARASFQGLRGCGKTHLCCLWGCPPYSFRAAFAAPEVGAEEQLFRPAGLARFPLSHGLRRGLHSCAALRLQPSTFCPLELSKF